MIRYLAQYIPDEATLTAPLQQLLRKDVMWKWHHEHDVALQNLKVALTQAPKLKFYDSYQESHYTCQCSKDGLGACVLQEGSLLFYASRTLSDAERNYTQSEKEFLVVVFAMSKVRQYICLSQSNLTTSL